MSDVSALEGWITGSDNLIQEMKEGMKKLAVHNKLVSNKYMENTQDISNTNHNYMADKRKAPILEGSH